MTNVMASALTRGHVVANALTRGCLCQAPSGMAAAVSHPVHFSTSSRLSEIQKMSRLRVVDNSGTGRLAEAAGKPAKCIQVYNKQGIGRIGDKVLVAIRGKKKKAYLVGCKQKQDFMVARFDSNNIVLLEDNGMPTGTRIKVPIPTSLRGKKGEFSKVLAIASKFV